MSSLSLQELEKKINSLNSAIVALKVAVNDVDCVKAKKALQIQIDTYTVSLKELLFEFSKRRVSQ